jgi:acyl-CoA reductase-like NAD-dependent aldehyde dehydrogenase
VTVDQQLRHTRRTISITDPRDGSGVGDIEIAGPDEIHEAVRAACEAFADWSAYDPAARGEMLRVAAGALEAREDELADLLGRETGKPRDDAIGGIRAGTATLRQYAELGPVHRGHSLLGSQRAIDYTVDHPRGVVLALTPWNDPVAIACGLLGAALVTGNTVIHKPSERSPHVGRLLGQVLAEQFPAEVLTTVMGDGDTGGALAAHPDVDVIAHVGATSTGLSIERAALETGAHVVRENGGNDALVVDADVDPAWAAEQAALGAYANRGQICTSVERIYVHRDVAEEFTDHLVRITTEMNESDDVAPLVDRRLRETVHAHVEDALARGAKALVGGFVPDSPGAHYPSTVLAGVDDSMLVMSEETFGPIAPVGVVDDFAEGLRRAAGDLYGLAATVLTRSISHAQQAAAHLPVGTIKVNAVFGGAPGGAAQPRGASGRGFGYGPELLDEMTTTTVVHIADLP